MPKAAPLPKLKEERLSETITILKKLQEVGIADTDPGYQQIKSYMSAWVTSGEAASYKVEFPRHGRRGELVLPGRAGRTATLSLKATGDAAAAPVSSSPTA
jgi:hypothetical protein